MHTYCVNVTREIEEPYIFHFKWNGSVSPTCNEVEALVLKEDINYKPDYEKFEFWIV